ncbi:hypothetical protein KY317_03855 [Candidatus Woesearchaeota archaeon]|nr:hypothetical protein [Candidatus Woesearchaeota archaeon]
MSLKHKIFLPTLICLIFFVLVGSVFADYYTRDHMDAATTGYNTSFWLYETGDYYFNDTIVYEGTGSTYIAANTEGRLRNLTMPNENLTCSVMMYLDGCYGGVVTGLSVGDINNHIGTKSNSGSNWFYDGNPSYIDSGIPVTKDNWNELAVIYNTNGTMTYILNGTITLGSAAGGTPLSYLSIGTFSAPPGCPVLFDDFKCWYGTYSDSPDDAAPPTNSSWNVTSGNVKVGESTSAWIQGGTINITSNLLSLTVTTNENSNGSCILDKNYNYTTTIAENSNYKFATTDTTSHSYTVFDNITIGNHCLYCSFIDDNSNEFANSSSGCLPIQRFLLPVGGKAGDGIYLHNDSTTMYLNETKLNNTIDLRDDDCSVVGSCACVVYEDNSMSGNLDLGGNDIFNVDTIGNSTDEIGDIYIANDKKTYFGNDQNAYLSWDSANSRLVIKVN